MKKALASVVISAVVLCLVVLVVKRAGKAPSNLPVKEAGKDPASTSPKRSMNGPRLDTLQRDPAQAEPHVPNQSERLRMSDGQRLRLLEDLGCVPSDPHPSDYWLAEKTSWWGKRIDPNIFWSNRVVWLDRSAQFEARRRGRGYPPMPYDDPSVADRSDRETRGDTFQIEGPNIHYVSSAREAAFWDQFIKTHPQPPDDIASWLQERAANWLRRQYILEHDPTYAARLGLKPESMGELLESDARGARVFGYPPECQASDAYLWAHILQQRQEYEAIRANGQDTDTVTLTNFFRRVYVDRKYITDALSAEDIQAANAWKIAYLRRLRQEKTDESYINAYIQAWNLSSNDVFGIPQEPPPGEGAQRR